MTDEALNTAFEMERHFAAIAVVGEGDPNALGQIGVLAEALEENVEVEFDIGEDVPVGEERAGCTGFGQVIGVRSFVQGGLHLPDRRGRNAALVLLTVNLAAPTYLYPHFFREGVHN